jgi:uncharacterized protein YggU (UPF0235/DUF167 family)
MPHRVVEQTTQGAILTVQVQPRASCTEFVGLHDGALKFRVAAIPREEAANDALRRYLAERFGIPKTAVAVQTGAGSRRKRVLLRGVSADRVRSAFGVPAPM